jgi:hypothetical protein
MLLTYLCANFLEEGAFVAANETTLEALARLTHARVFPAPSYVYESNGTSASFVSRFEDTASYRFHLKGHSAWLETVTEQELTTERQAQQHFLSRYDAAKQVFFESDPGRHLHKFGPAIKGQFDNDHARATWDHFTNGVYGVCTRDGQPESIFQKQALVMFIEHMIANGPTALSKDDLQLLCLAVRSLDAVESDFAPNEVAKTSRQRCIIDVRANFLRHLPIVSTDPSKRFNSAEGKT